MGPYRRVLWRICHGQLIVVTEEFPQAAWKPWLQI